ncbi:fibronectin type III domain-containing protein [Actinoplanes sp. CA-051413]|uniref:fibronectin type III domain-containing protein n=1 Tax=Actinoplanes sp. CA-051413 TaxID=3239899 RepID=UPI003D99A10E
MGDVRRFAARTERALRSGRRGRLPLVLVVGTSLVAVTAAVSGAASAPPGVRFAQAGHWFANPAEDLIYHVNGSAHSVDARARIDGLEPGSQVVQGDTTGYVVGSTEILEFGKSTLAVEQTLTPPAGERPVAVEGKGGPYLVYRETGTVVRLGTEPRTIKAGEPLGEPAVTPDGTLWLHRTGTNALCLLRPGADLLSCPAAAPPGHAGAMTVVGSRAVFVDTDTNTLTPVTGDGLGRSTPAGVDLPAGAGIAAADVHGRLAVLDPQQHKLHLIDASTVGSGRPAAAPVPVELPAGSYSVPAAGRSSVVLLDREHGSVLTYDRDGRRQSVTDVPPESGDPRLSLGQDDRVYVEGGEGRQVLVVDDRGRARAVPPAGGGSTPGDGATPGGPGTPADTRPATQPGRPGTPTRPAGPPSTPDNPSTTGSPATIGSPPAVGAGTVPRTSDTGPPSTRKAVPASPPGMPPRVRAGVTGTNIVVSWGAAAGNGAAVSGYRVSWGPAGGGSESTTRSGSSRSATLTGITAGMSYRITVAAENAAGRGPAATVSAIVPEPAPERSLVVSRGDPTTYDHGCNPPECAFVKVTMRGFEPNTAYDIDPWASDWGHFNTGARLTTDSLGNLTARHRFPFNGVGQEVWVIVDGMESNRLVWTAG